ncbi:hypothetical protein RclHR1_10950005 [Rhizophagus clarus]|uniref:BTB domain-containing protein n=1 Tax=Rhizophagus clarus TaxID=94130 RepID=A0A2Z6Q2Y1_9GLOM|nr:hypothetical protein RclHR1_10950005 [Rhizophagus clarus]GET03115.1 hypothetical protein GLOIN_2v1844191 [Rhizophagus clarus]
MFRGNSLERDLKLLINNQKYSDIEILCKDEKVLYGSRAILAARSFVFEGLLYNGMKESREKQISFPTIHSSIMEIILEYVYTGSIDDEHLTKDNIIELYYVADYFQLGNIQDFIMTTIRKILEKNHTKNYLPELLSKIVDTKALSADSTLLNYLAETVALIPLNNIEYGQLSIAGLQYLLSYTHEKNKVFGTPEYEVFRYSSILAAKQVSDDAFQVIMRQLPTLEEIKSSTSGCQNSKQSIANRIEPNHQKICIELEPLMRFIDFSKINVEILSDIIEPLNIIPTEIILNTYRQKAKLNKTDLGGFRGIPYNFIDYVWDEMACGSKLVVEDNGKVVTTRDDCFDQGIKSKVICEDKGIFEWDVIIETNSDLSMIGFCTPENFDFENTTTQSVEWVLSTEGNCYNSGLDEAYCSSFGDGACITVHLNMNKRSCAFTVNGVKYPEVARWNNLPPRLCPLVILSHPGRIRIKSHLETLFDDFDEITHN